MGATLSTAQLGWMRGQMNESLSRACSIPGGASTIVNNDDGTFTETPATPQTGIKCSFMAAAGNERVVGGAVAQVGNYVLTFQTGINLTPPMKVILDATAEERARTFNLVAPLDEPQMVGQRWLATEG